MICNIEAGLLLYILGNCVIIGQSWIGFSSSGREYRVMGDYRHLFLLVLIGCFYVGLALGVAGLIVLLTVYWWLPVLVFIIGHPVFRRYTGSYNR